MRNHPPSSHAGLRIRVSLLDVSVAMLAPVLALYLRNALVLSPEGESRLIVYCALSTILSLTAFVLFRIHQAIPRYLAFIDLVRVVFSVVFAGLMTCSVLFTLTRLDGVPRSVPAIQGLILAAGLIGSRAVAWMVNGRSSARSSVPIVPENIIIIGATNLAVLFIRYLDAVCNGELQVIAFLDQNPKWYGRSVKGVRVYGPPTHLAGLISEFSTHGVAIHRVVVAVEEQALPETIAHGIRRLCEQRGLELIFLPEFFKFDLADRLTITVDASVVSGPVWRAANDGKVPRVSGYFPAKRLVDLVFAAALLVALAPLWLIAAAAALIDVGTPILFWQQRLGVGGRPFQLYKLRTLRPAFDRDGVAVPETQRVSRIGKLLRQTRLDELPQLINVLIGDMSLVGPRPLLPQDQPEDPTGRLLVRPGITGWAQVNGGALLGPDEKQALDAWYIVRASFWIDFWIIVLTLRSLLKGDRRSDAALARARKETIYVDPETGKSDPYRLSVRFVSAGNRPVPLEERERSRSPLL